MGDVVAHVVAVSELALRRPGAGFMAFGSFCSTRTTRRRRRPGRAADHDRPPAGRSWMTEIGMHFRHVPLISPADRPPILPAE